MSTIVRTTTRTITAAVVVASVLMVSQILPALATSTTIAPETVRAASGTVASPIPGTSSSQDPSMSADGRYVVFESETDGWTSYDTDDGTDHVYRFDTKTHTIEIVDVGDNAGTAEAADGTANNPDISADGSVVVFESWAENLPGITVTNSEENIIAYDFNTQTYEYISVGGTLASPVEFSDSSGSPSISADGRYVVFQGDDDVASLGDSDGHEDIFMKDRQTDTLTLISKGTDGEAYDPAISSDGKFVAYTSYATDVVAGDTNSDSDVFLYDIVSDSTIRVSDSGTVASPVEADDSSRDPELSADGNLIVFESDAENLVASDTNSRADIFVFNRTDHSVERVSVLDDAGSITELTSDSEEPDISADGRFVVYSTSASNTPTSPFDPDGELHVLVADLETGVTGYMSEPQEEFGFDGDYELSGESENPVLSADGSTIAYSSELRSLVETDSDDYPSLPDTEDVFVQNNILFTDSDGVTNEVEAAAPNDGDANDDGIKDVLQAEVTSTVSPFSEKYVVLEAGGVCSANQAVSITGESNAEDEDDDLYDYPAGLLDFTMTGCTTGGTETITQYYYGDYDVEDVVVRKYDNSDDSYTTIESATISTVTIGGESALRVSYDVTDGGELDADGAENGVIVDPVGVGTLAAVAPDTGYLQASSSSLIALLSTGVAFAILGVYGYLKKNN